MPNEDIKARFKGLRETRDELQTQLDPYFTALREINAEIGELEQRKRALLERNSEALRALADVDTRLGQLNRQMGGKVYTV